MTEFIIVIIIIFIVIILLLILLLLLLLFFFLLAQIGCAKSVEWLHWLNVNIRLIWSSLCSTLSKRIHHSCKALLILHKQAPVLFAAPVPRLIRSKYTWWPKLKIYHRKICCMERNYIATHSIKVAADLTACSAKLKKKHFSYVTTTRLCVSISTWLKLQGCHRTSARTDFLIVGFFWC